MKIFFILTIEPSFIKNRKNGLRIFLLSKNFSKFISRDISTIRHFIDMKVSSI